MKKFLSRLKKFLIIFLITIVLLEISSYIILRVTAVDTKDTETTSAYRFIPLTIYEKNTDNGVIVPSKEAVVPVKKNYNSRWSSEEFNVSVQTNARGMRENYAIENKDVDIAFFGDSFTFGHGVEVEERFSNVVADSLPEMNVANFAYLSGFQPEHYEYFIKKNPDLKPKHVVIGMYIGNDLHSDLKETIYNRETDNLEIPMRLISEEGMLYNAPKLYRFPINKLIGYSNFTKLLVKNINRTRYRVYLFEDMLPNVPNTIELETGRASLENNRGIVSLKEIQKMVQSRGGKLTVLLIPQNYFFSRKNPHIHHKLKDSIDSVIDGNNVYKAFEVQLKAENIDFIDPMPVLEENAYFDMDAHWNAKGHARVGTKIAEHLKNK